MNTSEDAKLMKNLTDTPEWQSLSSHQHQIATQHMRDWFEQDPHRFNQYSVQVDQIFLDYSRNRVQSQSLALLCELARVHQLADKIHALFSGNSLNFTENRAALHSALRDQNQSIIKVDGQNIRPAITNMQQKMKTIVLQIQNGEWRGATGKPIKHIINVGIGGSHLGPMMTVEALKDFAVCNLDFHFISSVDKTKLLETLERVDLEASVFIISSKTFTTIETLTNTNTILTAMHAKLGKNVLRHHFVAVTAATDKALALGIPQEHILPLWDWIGGRYSIWSAIGLPLMLLLGPAQFDEFLAGGFTMDQHFQEASFEKNMPVILALLGIWYNNFFGASSQAIIPYSQRLQYFIPYLQQAEMESNGKSIDKYGRAINYRTGTIIFGQEGCDGQHAYHQLLHQGNHLIPADFILIGKPTKDIADHHQDILLASGLSQAQALMRGKTYQEAYDELLAANYSDTEAKTIAPHRVIPGNRPSNVIFMERLTPKNLGSLIALYEHKIFVQGIIWQINSFDQWGVELGKQLLPSILNCVQGKSSVNNQDPATAGLIQHLMELES